MWDVDVRYFDYSEMDECCLTLVSTLDTHMLYEAWFCIYVLVHKGIINVSHDCVQVITYTGPTCSQKAMGSKQQLWGDLHFGFALVFKSGKVSLVLIGCHLFPGPVIRWNGTDEFVKIVLSWIILKGMEKNRSIKLTVTVRFIQDLWFDYLLNHVLQCYQTHDLVERISLPFIVHFLDNGQVRFSCEEERQSNWDFRNISPLRKVLQLSFHPLQGFSTVVVQRVDIKRIM